MDKKNIAIIVAFIVAAIAAVAITFFVINKKTIKKTSIETTTHIQEAETTKEVETTTEAPKKNEAKVETYISDNGNITIEYPIVRNMQDENMQNKINETIKTNAVSIIKYYPIKEKDTANIKCSINYLDSSRISILYNGNINNNTKVFYSNTVDLNTNHNIEFKELLAPQAMANLLSNGKEEFLNADEKTTKELRKYIKNNYSKKKLTSIFESADFKDKGITDWPYTFSYENGDTVFFSIKVSEKLGNFAIIKYNLETK